ncbi:MAG: hypothetical protein Q4F83_09430 [Eubacteriales bacterium]|nr:hypothetical protein [Eubacteriales bacterium]
MELQTGKIRYSAERINGGLEEKYQILCEGKWIDAINTIGFPTVASPVPVAEGGESHGWEALKNLNLSQEECKFDLEKIESHVRRGISTIKTYGIGPLGKVIREVRLDDVKNLAHVKVSFVPSRYDNIISIEDKLFFAPETRKNIDGISGPLDFIWSQQIKREESNYIPHWCFKSPVIMFQQGNVFAAIVPDLSKTDHNILRETPLGMDLGVPEESKAWFSCGIISGGLDKHSEVHAEGHSYYPRSCDPVSCERKGCVTFSYDLLLSEEPFRQGYRRGVKYLWESIGHKQLLQSVDNQRNPLDASIIDFEDWADLTWYDTCDRDYTAFEYNGRSCGLLTSRRTMDTIPDASEKDGWYQIWAQSLRTAYGWARFGLRINDTEVTERAKGILNAVLAAPRNGGAFPAILGLGEDGSVNWYRDDTWAGYKDEYHAVNMGWTGYWLLQWEDICPQAREDIFVMCNELAEFFVRNQNEDGCIPAWYNSNLEAERKEFKDFNAECSACALFLAEMYKRHGNEKYLNCAEKVACFILEKVIPRNRWYDLEAFLSCSPKPFDYYDAYTAQFPQCNMAQIFACQAFLVLYQVTEKEFWLENGAMITDYTALTQAVWNHPLIRKRPTLGGYTTQNTDGEWCDHRQDYMAVIFMEYYRLTGNVEYLERGVAALRAGFATYPYENFAHCGENGMNYISGVNWGIGTAQVSAEIMCPILGDIYINLEYKHAIGVNASTISDFRNEGNEIFIDAEIAEGMRNTLHISVEGANKMAQYSIYVNGTFAGRSSGIVLNEEGIDVTVSKIAHRSQKILQ